jgi:spermidine synthase
VHLVTRFAVLALTIVTGFSGLVYEVTWQRWLATLLGADSQATALVLAYFLGGLALGYTIFGRLTRRLVERSRALGRHPRLLRVYGGVEASIGLWALVFPALFGFVRSTSMALPGASGSMGFVLDAVLCSGLVVPPALLMGATIPLLTQALSRNLEDATRWHAWVYGVNSLGAFAGALAAGFWLLPELGLVGSLRAMALANLLAGAAFVWLDRTAPASPVEAPTAGAVEASPERGLAAAALCIGFAMMTLQTTLVRVGALSLGASQFTFSMVVAVFVLAIAIGSLAVSLPVRWPRWVLVANLWALLLALAWLYGGMDEAPYAAHVLRSLFRDQPASFLAYHIAVFMALLALVGPPVVLSGATLPLLFHAMRREASGLGAVAGNLYAWNTLGSLLGALIGGYLALTWLDLHHVYRLALVAIALAAVLASTRIGVPRLVSAGLVGAAVLAIVLLGAWVPQRLAAGLFRIRTPVQTTYLGADAFFRSYADDPLIFYDDDPVQSVSIKERVHASGFRNTSIATNGKGDGSLLYDYPTMGLAALIPAMLAETPKRAFVIGWGTGVSAGELAALESVQEVVVAEISPAVVAAATHFAHGNLDAANDAKVRIVTGDAYRTLLRTDGQFDVILSEPSNPWVVGVEMLFSRELLEASAARLSPGGVHLQWMHLYEIDRESLDLVLRTYLSVFDEVSLWYGLGVDLFILGRHRADPERDLSRLVERVALPDFAAGLARSGVHGLPSLLAHELWPSGVLREAGLEGDVHTLMHPRLSHGAARAFFAGKQARLPTSGRAGAAELGAQRSLVRHYEHQLGRGLSEDETRDLVIETCRHRATECLTLLAWWARERPGSARRARALEAIRLGGVGDRDGPLMLHRLDRVQALYDPTPFESRVDPLLEAKRATDLFYIHHHHAAPFPRAHLETVWRRCASVPEREAECGQARALAESHLGPLGRDERPESEAPNVVGHAPVVTRSDSL